MVEAPGQEATLYAIGIATAIMLVVHFWERGVTKYYSLREAWKMAREQRELENRIMAEAVAEAIDAMRAENLIDDRRVIQLYKKWGRNLVLDDLIPLSREPQYKLIREAMLKSAIAKRIARGEHRAVKLPDGSSAVVEMPVIEPVKMSPHQFFKTLLKRKTSEET